MTHKEVTVRDNRCTNVAGKEFQVTKVVNMMTYRPYQWLTEKEVAYLCDNQNVDVIITM